MLKVCPHRTCFLPLILAALLAGAAAARAAPALPPPPTGSVYVHDLAGLLDPATARELAGVGAALERATGGAQVVVVTVPTLDATPIEEYATALFRAWGIGSREKNNGVLLLVDRQRLEAGQNGKVRIEVGYGLEGAIPDGKAGRILDEQVLPAWAAGDVAGGIRHGYLALAAEVAAEYGVDFRQVQELAPLAGYRSEERGDGFPLAYLLLLLLLLGFFGPRGRGRYRRYYRGPFWGGGFGGGGFGGGGFGGGGFGGGSSGGGGASR